MIRKSHRRDAATAAVSPDPAGSCRNFRTGCSTGSTGSGSGNTAATAERTTIMRNGEKTDNCVKL